MNGTLKELVKEEMERRMENLRRSNKEIKEIERHLAVAKTVHMLNAGKVAELIEASGKESYLYSIARYSVVQHHDTGKRYLAWEDATDRGLNGGQIELER